MVTIVVPDLDTYYTKNKYSFLAVHFGAFCIVCETDILVVPFSLRSCVTRMCILYNFGDR